MLIAAAQETTPELCPTTPPNTPVCSISFLSFSSQITESNKGALNEWPGQKFTANSDQYFRAWRQR